MHCEINIHTLSKDELNLSLKELEALENYFPNGLISIDLETTGLSPLVDRIIEIAAVKIDRSGLSIFETLINPEIPIPEHTTDIHHITDEMVKDSPHLKNTLQGFKDFIGNSPLVAHNAKFDMGFLVAGFQKNQIALPSSEVFCSCKFARSTHPESPNHKLQTLVEICKIKLINHHRAADDAKAALQIFISSLMRLSEDMKSNRERILKEAKLFHLDDFNKIEVEQIPKHLIELKELVKTSAVVEIEYSGGSHKNQFRPVKLTSLLNSPEGNILYARCLLSDIYKSFKLNKITKIRTPKAEDIQRWLKK